MGKNDFENIENNTYGIEIEFGTHDNQMLSFTHIEVCYLFLKGAERYKGWKIETDADYTLELVSPILKFKTQVDARDFRNKLMRFLERMVRTGILLGSLMNHLKKFVAQHFEFAGDKWIYAEQDSDVQENLLDIEWINNKEMLKALSWENWDEDTDLQRVLASRRMLEAGDNINIEQEMKQVLLTKSRKHGNLPSSQLNLPLPLEALVPYETKDKRDKAWKRLLEDPASDEAIKKKMKELVDVYPELFGNEEEPPYIKGDLVWKAKYFNRDYIESRIEEKIPFWQRYWLWLETFFVSASFLMSENETSGIEGQLKNYESTVNSIVDSPLYSSTEQAKEKMKDLKSTNTLKGGEFFSGTDRVGLIVYITICKIVSGTFSEMSETLQKVAQEKIMDLKGNMTMDQIKCSIPNNQFMQFHYALKDLTSLWFKATLMDTLAAEDDDGKKAEMKIKNFPDVLIADVVSAVLYNNLRLLGWYFSVLDANNEGFKYDWDAFCAYNMPSIPQFKAQLESTCRQLKDYLNAPTVKCIATLNELPPDKVIFLQRSYPQGNIAPWEGRWDTMKPVIKSEKPPRYLVEHRNN